MDAISIEHISIDPRVCGGKPHIAGHRITVQDVAIWHERLGLYPDEIATEYGLTLGEIYSGLAYYHDHRLEIDASILAADTLVREMRRKIPSKVATKLSGRAD